MGMAYIYQCNNQKMKAIQKFSAYTPSLIIRSEEPIVSKNPVAKDLLKQIYLLPSKGVDLAFNENKLFPLHTYETIKNHFQGIVRLRDGKHFAISGGDNINDEAHLFIGKLESHPGMPGLKKATGPITSNILFSSKVSQEDAILKTIVVEKGRNWHAGGIAASGDIMAVPVEDKEGGHSLIRFLDMSNPEYPEMYPYHIVRQGEQAGACAITQLDNGRFLCIVWSDSDDGLDRFDFYLSHGSQIPDGFSDKISIPLRDIHMGTDQRFWYQSIQLVEATEGLFLLAFSNSKKAAPVAKGTNQLSIFKLDLASQTTRLKDPELAAPKMYSCGIRNFDSGRSYYNFAAAVGTYVNSRGVLSMYSAHHWRRAGTVRFAEFYPLLDSAKKKIKKLRDGQIELYEHKHYQGDALRLFGSDFIKYPDLKEIYVRGSNFGDKISSLRMQLPLGYQLELYANEKYRGKKMTFKGSGVVMTLPDLGKFNDHCSSLKVVKTKS